MQSRELAAWIFISITAMVGTIIILLQGNNDGSFNLLCLTIPVSLSIILPISGILLDRLNTADKDNINKNFGNFVTQLANSDVNKRRDAAKKLAFLGDEQVVVPLKAALVDDDLEVRLYAAKHLVNIKDTLVDASLRDSISGFSAALIDADKINMRHDIARLLSNIRRRFSLTVDDIPGLGYCEKCLQRTGMPVIIYYGDKTKADTKASGGVVTTTTYSANLRGAMTVLLCEECGNGNPEKNAIKLKTSMFSPVGNVDTLIEFCCTRQEAVERFGVASVSNITPLLPFYQL